MSPVKCVFLRRTGCKVQNLGAICVLKRQVLFYVGLCWGSIHVFLFAGFGIRIVGCMRVILKFRYLYELATVAGFRA